MSSLSFLVCFCNQTYIFSEIKSDRLSLAHPPLIHSDTMREETTRSLPLSLWEFSQGSTTKT